MGTEGEGMRTIWLRVLASLAIWTAGVATAVPVAAATTAGPVGMAAGAGPASTGAPPGRSAPAAAERTLTLITGDRVVVSQDRSGRPRVRFEPGPGRRHVPFVESRTPDGHIRVVPADAQPLIASGRLDGRLFDVTALIEQGYADDERSDLPLIVAHQGLSDAASDLRAQMSAAGVHVEKELPSIDAMSVAAPKATVAALWEDITSGPVSARELRPGLDTIWLDGRVHASLDESVPQIGAPTAWKAGLTGKNVRVAVLDTGIDASHPDLADAVVAARDFTESGSTVDGNGHGTHVASIITGSGAASDGRYAGVAPDARLLVGKVLDDSGSGYESWIIAGMEWATTTRKARVVNMSLGGCPTDGTDPLARAVNRLTRETGALFTIAAGNHPIPVECREPDHLVASPASANQALAVGSVTKQGALSEFSNVGPRAGDGAVKPELTAPGQDIVAARADQTSLGEPVGDHYTRLSGTSMAAPHVAGAAAILAQKHPAWRAKRLRAALLASATPNSTLGVFAQGAGRVDVARAVRQRILVTPSSVSLGIARWPHDDDKPIAKVVSYETIGRKAVTLHLTLRTLGPTGRPAPRGMFTLSRDSIRVAPGTTAKVTVRADPKRGRLDGTYSAWLVARAGGRILSSTPIGLVREVESYDLTLDARDRSGNRVETLVEVVDVTDADTEYRTVPLAGEPVTLRLPKGRYDLSAAIFEASTVGDGGDTPVTPATLAARPDLVLDRDMTVRLDARKAKRVQAIVDSPTAEPHGYQAAWVQSAVFGHRLWGGNDPNVGNTPLYATPTVEVRDRAYLFGHYTTLSEPEPMTTDEPARAYHLYLTTQGRVPDPPTFTVHDADLARVDLRLHSQGVTQPQTGSFVTSAYDDFWSNTNPNRYDVIQPSRRIAYFSAGPDLMWERSLETDIGGETAQPRSFTAGARYVEHWNAAAIGPIAHPFYYRPQQRLFLGVNHFSPATEDHTAFPGWLGTTATTTLRRDGEVVGTSDEPDGGSFEVPTDRARLEVTTEATREVDWSRLATRVSATWTFDAGPLDSDFNQVTTLGLHVGGSFDLLDRAPAGETFQLDVSATRADPDAAISEITLDVSFDDGATWHPLTLHSSGTDRWQAEVSHPADAEFVSLRASARDTSGNRVEQTVIRAYGLRS